MALKVIHSDIIYTLLIATPESLFQLHLSICIPYLR